MLAAHQFGLKPPTAVPRHATGVETLDAVLSGGFAHGRLHEIYAAETDDLAGATGFGAIIAAGMATETKPPIWLRTKCVGRIIQGEGWAALGGTPGNCLFLLTDDAKALLRAAVDALRSNALGAVIAEVPGRMAELDLTASRRLALAAEKSGTALFLLRSGAEPVPSAAETRWRVAAAPSRALPANAPGAPVFAIELLRQRSGPSGLSWQLEWNRDRRIFTEAASGDLVSVPRRGSPAAAGAGPVPFGQRAA